MTAFVARGTLSLGGVSVGVTPQLTLTVEAEQWRRESWDGTPPGGPESVSVVPTRATLAITLNDLIAANISKLTLDKMEDDGTYFALSFVGVNCIDDSAITLTAPIVIFYGTTGLDLVTDGFGAPVLNGEILRNPGGSPEWFTLALG